MIRIPIEPDAKTVDHMKDSPIVRDRGRQKETISQSIKRKTSYLKIENIVSFDP